MSLTKTWKAEYRLKNMASSSEENVVLEIKFLKDARIKTKKWKIWRESPNFSVLAKKSGSEYLSDSYVLQHIVLFLKDNIVHRDCTTESDVEEWRRSNAKYGPTYLKNEDDLNFGKRDHARIFYLDASWYLNFDSSDISYSCIINTTSSSDKQGVSLDH